jgi:hypothetical protein
MIFIILIYAVGAFAAEQLPAIPPNTPKLKQPILITPCGQSPGGVYMKVICRQLKLDADLEDSASVETLAKRPYQTLIIITGTSLKGMGSAGIDIDQEVKRCTNIVNKAKSIGIKVVVAQIEGASRRVDETDEKSIKSMTPLADLLITHKEINGDGYFTKIAEEKKIPQIFISQQLDLLQIFPLVFAK